MRKYRRVSPAVWSDEKFGALSRPKPNAQTLWLYLLTCNQRTIIPGLIRDVGPATLAECLGWPVKTLLHCWREIEAAGMAQADWQARLIWQPNGIKHEPPENGNQVIGWRSAFDELPACALAAKVRETLERFLTAERPEWVKHWGTVAQTVPPTVTQTATETVSKQGTGTRTRTGAGARTGAGSGELDAAAAPVHGGSHKAHALCGEVCLPAFLLHDFARLKGGDEHAARGYVEQWWARLDDELKRDGRPTIGDEAKYLRNRWSADHPTPRLEPRRETKEQRLDRLMGVAR